ncbi:MAG: type II toxin-antitoxin system prevent-host-death family antitoxin [Clostridia bacterium]|nr:type II toxin-antitoxin system prevent-host-death family antitoxin [Clostridia bacterium]
MIEVEIDEARTRIVELLDRVARGERVTITRHGVPVARLVPPEEGGRRPVEKGGGDERGVPS